VGWAMGEYDNAMMESFWATLKRELVYRRRFATRAEAYRAIFEYIEAFYNRERLHNSRETQNTNIGLTSRTGDTIYSRKRLKSQVRFSLS
jgi:transposase InsO family protein